jgi:hypothetical protein
MIVGNFNPGTSWYYSADALISFFEGPVSSGTLQCMLQASMSFLWIGTLLTCRLADRAVHRLFDACQAYCAAITGCFHVACTVYWRSIWLLLMHINC